MNLYLGDFQEWNPIFAARPGTLLRCSSFVWLATRHSSCLASHPARTTLMGYSFLEITLRFLVIQLCAALLIQRNSACNCFFSRRRERYISSFFLEPLLL